MAICPNCNAQGELAKECQNCGGGWHYIENKNLAQDPMLGSLVGGQYVPLALIGEGGMGRIYRAKAKYTGQMIALKILKSEYMEDETLKDRFFREAEVVSALDHPNIVKLYGCAPDDKHKTVFMAMELLKGRTLFDVFRKGVTDLPTMIRWFVEISSALGEAHHRGIFHRDLKPENVFIVKDEQGEEHVKVLDFGFARLQSASKKLTMAGVAFGTPHYMSPEQAMGMIDITAGVDVYAMGIMLFQAISGDLPYDSKTPMEVMYAQVHSATPKCTPRQEYRVPDSLIKCIYKCMKKEPVERYADGNELCDVLKGVQAEIESAKDEYAKPTVLLQPIEGPKPKKASKDFALNKTSIILISILVVVIAIVVVVAVRLFG